MTDQALMKLFTVQLHRRGGRTTGHVEVQARSAQHAARVAVDQTIAVSYPKSKPAAWIVTKVTALPRKTPEQQVADWNNLVGMGQEVDYRSYPEAEPQRFKTRTEACVLSGHTAVVWLEGKSGCVTVESCAPVVEGGAA